MSLFKFFHRDDPYTSKLAIAKLTATGLKIAGKIVRCAAPRDSYWRP